MDFDLDALIEATEIPLSADRPIGGTGGGSIGRPHGVIERRVEEIDGREFLVEVFAPESFPTRRTGNGKVGKYARPKPKWVVSAGAGSGLWTGSDIDRTLLNCVLRHTARAMRYAKRNGSCIDAPWEVLGKRNLYRAVRAARDFESENCPVHEQEHVLDDMMDDFDRLLRELS
jgi:hypothetical protein